MRYDCVLNYRKMHGIIMGKNVYNGKKYVREALQVAMGTFLLAIGAATSPVSCPSCSDTDRTLLFPNHRSRCRNNLGAHLPKSGRS